MQYEMTTLRMALRMKLAIWQVWYEIEKPMNTIGIEKVIEYSKKLGFWPITRNKDADKYGKIEICWQMEFSWNEVAYWRGVARHPNLEGKRTL